MRCAASSPSSATTASTSRCSTAASARSRSTSRRRARATRLLPLIREADVLIEQFRPGVMDRLGLGYDALRAENPRLIWCSITGYGQSGPKAQVAAHDLNYIAETGMLGLSAGSDGAPGDPAGADRRHRGRRLSRGHQHPARPPAARAHRRRLPARHRDDRPAVPADVLGARQRLGGRPLAASGRRAGDRRLAPLPDLPDRRRPLPRRRPARAALLGPLLRADRPRGALPRRCPRSRGDDRARRRDHPGAAGRALAGAVRGRGRLLRDRADARGGACGPAFPGSRPVRP